MSGFKAQTMSLLRQAKSVLMLEDWRRNRREKRVHRLSVGEAAGLNFSTGPAELGYATGDNEMPVQRAMASVLREGMVVYDVGANVGFMTVLAAAKVGGSGVVYSIEPVPENVQWIRHNVGINRMNNVEIVEKAVSNTIGREQLNVAEYSGGSALSSVDEPPDTVGAITVEVTTIDEMVRSGCRPPGLVKIDVEGAELQVFQGMTATIAEHHPAVLYEVDGPDLDSVNEKADILDKFLRAYGYSIEELEDAYPDNQWRVRHYLATT